MNKQSIKPAVESIRGKLAILNNDLRGIPIDLTLSDKDDLMTDIKIINISIKELIHHINK